MHKYRNFLSALLLISLAACNPLNSSENKPAPTYTQNQAPKHRYDITMTVKNAPGLFASVKSFSQYDVINSDCLPPPDSNPGGYNSPTPTAEPVVTFKKLSDTEYIGTFYTDMMVDEDYYGRGVCRWKLIQAGVRLRATGAEGETTFFSALRTDDLVAEQEVTTQFLKKSYPRHPESMAENPLAFGKSNYSSGAPLNEDDEIFTITLTPKEVRQ